MGIILALIIVISMSMGGSSIPLALDYPYSGMMAESLGFIIFITVIALFIKRCLK